MSAGLRLGEGKADGRVDADDAALDVLPVGSFVIVYPTCRTKPTSKIKDTRKGNSSSKRNYWSTCESSIPGSLPLFWCVNDPTRQAG